MTKIIPVKADHPHDSAEKITLRVKMRRPKFRDMPTYHIRDVQIRKFGADTEATLIYKWLMYYLLTEEFDREHTGVWSKRDKNSWMVNTYGQNWTVKFAMELSKMLSLPSRGNKRNRDEALMWVEQNFLPECSAASLEPSAWNVAHSIAAVQRKWTDD